MPAWLVHVGYRGKTGNHLLVVSFTGFDPGRVPELGDRISLGGKPS
jgi:hypothetical protein